VGVERKKEQNRLERRREHDRQDPGGPWETISVRRGELQRGLRNWPNAVTITIKNRRGKRSAKKVTATLVKEGE